VFRIRHFSGDRGDIIARQLIVALLIVVAIGFLLAEGGLIIWGRLSAAQSAEDLAGAIAFNYKMYHNEQEARQEAGDKMRLMAFDDKEILESVVQFLPEADANKTTVRVTVVKYINTLFTRHLGPLKKFSRVVVSKDADVATASPSRN
jgi:hypothetical protein